MKKQYRIKKSSEIESVLKNKDSYGNKYFTVYKKNSETSYFRYAISVGKKIGNAVRRNRVKRQMRVIISNMCDQLYSIDIFIVAKPSVNELSFDEMKKHLKYLFKKLNVKIKGESY